MIGCSVWAAWALACLFGDESQHPTWPQVRHTRGVAQRAPIRRVLAPGHVRGDGDPVEVGAGRHRHAAAPAARSGSIPVSCSETSRRRVAAPRRRPGHAGGPAWGGRAARRSRRGRSHSPSTPGAVAAYRVGSAPMSALCARRRLLIEQGALQPGRAECCSSVAAYPGCAATPEISDPRRAAVGRARARTGCSPPSAARTSSTDRSGARGSSKRILPYQCAVEVTVIRASWRPCNAPSNEPVSAKCPRWLVPNWSSKPSRVSPRAAPSRPRC